MVLRIIVTSFLLCSLFACLVFLSKISAKLLGIDVHSLSSIGAPSQWSINANANFTPGRGSRQYRQEVYSKAIRQNSRHLHKVRKYRVQSGVHQKALKRVCYLTLPDEKWPSLNPEEIDGSLCTHIIIGFAQVQNATLIPILPQDAAFYQRVASMKEAHPDLKVMLSVGGGNTDEGFRELVTENQKLVEFSKNSAQFLKSLSLDGIDIDWEFPAWYTPFEERFLFVKFLQQLHLIYKNPSNNLLISVAVAAPKSIVDRSYRVAEMAHYVDFINLMGYDFHSFKWYLPLTGHNSPLYPRSNEWNVFQTVNLNFSAYYWVQLGMPKEKLVIGLPTYGQTYALYNPSFYGVYAPAIGFGLGGGQVSYPTVCQFLNGGGVREFDTESRVPYAYHKRDWISYDDEQSLQEKAEWIRNHNFGGVMVYDLNCDDFAGICGNVSFPLLRSIIRKLEP